ncbi:hypothetical protein ACFV9P_27995 [Streptomyces sp. NPDC059892]|uniref:hypothetical protein n=1 Tax=Streptomyces sp. NPDC059892 TaxID=3346989 RepID=UPI003664AF52
MPQRIGKAIRCGCPTASTTARRLIAVGTITRRDGRTTTVRATEAGVTGTITKTGGAR